MSDCIHVVTRLPGAPERRAGRVWPVGDTRVSDMTEAQVAAITADPGYRITQPRSSSDATAPVVASPKRSRGKAQP